MPVIFAIDCSLSMFLPLGQHSSHDSLIGSCKLGIASAAEFLSASYQRAVQLALVSFSSDYRCIMPFTREISSCKPALDGISCGDVVEVQSLVRGLNRTVLEAWGTSQMTTVVIITDGGVTLKTDGMASPDDQLSFSFPIKLHLVIVSSSSYPGSTTSTSQWDKILAEHGGSVHNVSGSTSSELVTEFSRFAVEHLQLPAVKIQLGCLSTYASVYPTSATFCSNEQITFDIGGFLPANNEIYNAEALSRHILLHREKDSNPNFREENQMSSFLASIYTVLKQEIVVAICRIREVDNQYAILHVSSDLKKRPCLNLAILKPGSIPISWLGPVPSLTLAALAPAAPSVIPQRKKSYNDASSHIAWSKAESLKSDVHRILRLAKKLPDKSSLFLKELNKLRSSSLTLGLVDLLNVVSSALTREASTSSSPEGKAMLTSFAEQLSSGPPSQEIDVDVVLNISK